jgi:uncharacterized repeat protein (TIGR03803 family)
MCRLARLAVLFCVAIAITSSAQIAPQFPKAIFSNLVSFDLTNGAYPEYGALVQGANGNLYGTTSSGGSQTSGTIFEITPSGSLTTLYNFCSTRQGIACTDGQFPYGGLVLATNGNFYGTTEIGGSGCAGTGSAGCGTVFELTAAGVLTTLYNFCSETNCTDGSEPYASLVQGTDGNLYGTTYAGGTSNYGTIFKITTAGSLTTLHSFDDTDGANPYDALIQATNGDFYGTTYQGGSGNGGTFFQITSTGTFSVLYNFCSETNCTDGENPQAGVIQDSNGDFYGTTTLGGTGGSGTVYQLTSAGELTTLYNEPSDGYQLLGGLVQGTDGKLYGTTDLTIFDITAAGKLTTLFTFNATDSENPNAALVQATDGTFYGTTTNGGGSGIFGTVFSIANGLGPFVRTIPTSGKVGAAVEILGTDLTGATSVTFDGIAATFKVVSGTEITTKVPTGAKTGTVEVVTPSGTLKSNAKFTIKG